MTTSLRPSGIVACLVIVLSHLSAQQPARPTFKSAVDLVPVDVSVVDKDGRPIADLTAGDFTLTVDGRARKVVSAQFVSVTSAVKAAPAAQHYSSNDAVAGGRLVVLAIDAGNIGTARGKGSLQAAARFVEQLNPADRVALVTLPGGGPQVDFTSDHQRVQSMLQTVVGQSTMTLGPRALGISEALAIERGDESMIAHVVEQQCSGDPSPASRESCLQQLTAESSTLLSDTRARTSRTIAALRRLFDRLGTSETPKTIVLVSEGLLLNSDYSDVAWIGPRASAGHVTLYVLQIDAPDMNMGERRESSSRREDREVMREGLDIIAGMARGDVFRIVSNADFAFRRLALELSGYYLVGFEPEPGDRDAKPHKIKVDVRRKDIAIRARREFSVAAAATRPTTDTLVLDTLRSPLLASDIPLELTTYTFQDPESQKVKVILSADLDRSVDAGQRISLGYILVDDKGKVTASQIENALTTPVHPETKRQTYVGAALTTPGVYTLKLAAVDEDGRRGSVERTFTAQLNTFGGLRVSDLLIADDSKTMPGSAGLIPSVDAKFTGGEVHGYVELFSDSAATLRDATVTIEVAESDSSKALDGVTAQFQGVEGGDRRRVAEAAVPIARLGAGHYVLRAAVAVNGQKVGQVLRPFEITRPAKTVAATPPPNGPKPAPAGATTAPGPDAFDRSSVLTPQVVGFFLDRLNETAGANTGELRPAIDNVKAGRFAEAMDALSGAGDDQLAAVFLKGLVLFSRGELNPAANKFREALKIDSEFSPATFYLGACYAAGGRDRDAAGALQMSLISESSAPIVYMTLSDTFMRLRDYDEAIQTLQEARRLWPSDEQLASRLASAQRRRK